jgi:Carboxypeptidase regulatory-like domain
VTRARFAILVLATAVLAACGGPAIPPAQNYATIRGRAFDNATNAPVAGVLVTVDTILTATTGSDGTYRIVNVPIGQYTLTVQPPQGYAPVRDQTGSVAAGETVSIDIPLTRQ